MTQMIRDYLVIAAAIALLAFIIKSWPVVDEVAELLEDAEKAKG
ncbi:hypothetical protein LCGC14_0784410 [marine sediment metagenome]|uniref:Uncharacterized protein n=1 Tax=marine sediment metagenome TaxID=412755 RepID=A0A0F9QEA7_9ZZZZ